ncbi:MAG: 30S ribosome-binding factor RbfA [Planctomycetota bacterium]|nr:30S ribosome-binding factor RbfA [Planctomycetota bacterium]
MNERRIRRLQELIKERAADVLAREISDPRLGLITITKVQLDREMQTCKIFWSILGSATERRTNERMLTHAARYIQKEIGKVLKTRRVPHVTFLFDESIEGAMRINKLLGELKTERETREAESEDLESDSPDPEADEPPEQDDVAR